MSTKEKENIREKYKGLSIYNPGEYKEIWDNSTIVLDTNILLNLYRYSDQTRKTILSVLEKFKERIWIPYQVIKEYYNNRDKVIDESLTYAYNLENFINKKNDEILEEVKNNSQKIEFIDKISKNIENNNKEIKKIFRESLKSKENNNKLKESLEIEKSIYDLIGDNYEKEFDYESIEEIIKEGDKRIKNKIPPGYRDSNKEEMFKEYQINGDYIIFNSIIEYAKTNNKNVIFITDDAKEDWIQIINGKKQGGRKELLQEFYEKTGKMLLIYSQEGFINKYNEQNPSESVSKETVKEIENINNKKFSIHIDNNNLYSEINNLYDNISIELTDTEKRTCLKIIANDLTNQLRNINYIYKESNEININRNDLRKNIQKINLYYIKKYAKYYDKIRSCELFIDQAIEKNDSIILNLYIGEIILNLNRIIKCVD